MKKPAFFLVFMLLMPAACAGNPALPPEQEQPPFREMPERVPIVYTHEEPITPSPLPVLDGGAAEERVVQSFAVWVQDADGNSLNAWQTLYYGDASSDELRGFLEIGGIRYDMGQIGERPDAGYEEEGISTLEPVFPDGAGGTVYAQYKKAGGNGAEAGFTDYYAFRDGAPCALFRVDGRTAHLGVFTDEYVKIWTDQTGWIYKYDGAESRLYGADVAKLIGCERVERDGGLYAAMEGDAILARYALVDSEFQRVSPGEPDRLGSWGSIGAALDRPADWERIVSDSPFKLGEVYIKGYWGPEVDQTPYYGFRYGTYPAMDGSTVAVPMALEFARQHLGLGDEDAREFVTFYTTHEAYVELFTKNKSPSSILREFYDVTALSDDTHPVDLVIATYPSGEELALAEQYGVKLRIEPVCRDAFVFITHKDNPADSLTLEEVRGIYSGGITNWKEVGGADLPIIAYQRDPNSGSQTGMEQLVMGGVPMRAAQMTQTFGDMMLLIAAVAEYENGPAAIGYTYKYYADRLYHDENIKILRIDGVAPDPANLASEEYPLTVNYYGAVREGDGAGSVGHRFLDWMRSDEGQRCIAQAGYAPLK
jgi:phosphate transport system substrate-binding protein